MHAPQDRPECRPGELLLQARKRPIEIDAGGQIRGKLPAELGELPSADSAEENSLPQRRALGGRLELPADTT